MMLWVAARSCKYANVHGRKECAIREPKRSDRPAHSLCFSALVAFGLYWFSSNDIESRDAAYLFHADTVMYWQLANGNVIDRLGTDLWLDRITRFHPVTTGMAVGWMKILSPLTPWITPHQLLKAMFTAVGAIGVWAALWAIAAVVPHRYVTVLGAIYATSLGVWYFSQH